MVLQHWARVQPDNVTAVAYINHQRGKSSHEALKEAIKPDHLMDEDLLFSNLCCPHPRIGQLEGGLPQQSLPRAREMDPSPQHLQLDMSEIKGTLTVDILASRINNKLPLFVARIKDPLALVSDALKVPWS